MGLLERLRAWWRRRAWSGGPTGARTAGDEPTAEHVCAVCGTGVDDPDGPCPLCRSSDVVPAGSRGRPAGDGAATGDGRDGTAADGPDGAPTGRDADGTRRVAASDDASVDRLRALRDEGELLQRYDDRWQAVDGGFRIETSGGTRVVDSREEVVALLRAEDG